jgi:hypothetical protein
MVRVEVSTVEFDRREHRNALNETTRRFGLSGNMGAAHSPIHDECGTNMV